MEGRPIDNDYTFDRDPKRAVNGSGITAYREYAVIAVGDGDFKDSRRRGLVQVSEGCVPLIRSGHVVRRGGHSGSKILPRILGEIPVPAVAVAIPAIGERQACVF